MTKTIDELRTELCYEGTITEESPGKFYYRYDSWLFEEDGDPTKLNWSIRCDIQEELKEYGWTLEDVYVDHDTICGYLKPLC